MDTDNFTSPAPGGSAAEGSAAPPGDEQQQQQQQQHAAAAGGASAAADGLGPKADSGGDEQLSFQVVGLDRAKKDTFKFEVATNLPHFKRRQYTKERTYAEFEKLRAHFVSTYPQVISPPLPCQFSHALTAEENERLVKTTMTRFLTRVADHPVLRKDDELRAFVESEFPFNPTLKPKYKSSVSSIRARFSRMVPSPSSSPPGSSSPRSSSGGKETPHASSAGAPNGEFVIDDDDVAFERMRKDAQIDEALGNVCAKAVANVVKARKGISFAYIDIVSKAAAMIGTDGNAAWASGLRKFTKCLQAMSELEQEQASSESAVLGDIFDMHVRVAKAIQEAAAVRASLKAEHDSIVRATEKKWKDLEKMKGASAIRPERVDDALEDLEESKRSQLQHAAQLSRVSHALRTTELETLEARHHADVLRELSNHARQALEHERAQLRAWEGCVLDIASVVNEPTVASETVDARGVAERLAGALL